VLGVGGKSWRRRGRIGRCGEREESLLLKGDRVERRREGCSSREKRKIVRRLVERCGARRRGIFFKGYSYVGVGGWIWRDDSGWHGEGIESVGRCGRRRGNSSGGKGRRHLEGEVMALRVRGGVC